MQVEGWTLNDPLAPMHVKDQWEIPDNDSYPADGSWDKPYTWDVETQEWVEGVKQSFDTHEEYSAYYEMS